MNHLSDSDVIAELATELNRQPTPGTPPGKDFSSIQKSILDLSASIATLRQEVAALPSQVRATAKADAARISKDHTRVMAEALVDQLVDHADRADGDLKVALKSVRADMAADLSVVKDAAAQGTSNAVALVSGFITHVCKSEGTTQ